MGTAIVKDMFVVFLYVSLCYFLNIMYCVGITAYVARDVFFAETLLCASTSLQKRGKYLKLDFKKIYKKILCLEGSRKRSL